MWFASLVLLAIQTAASDQTLEGQAQVSGSPAISAAVEKYLGCLEPTLERTSEKTGEVHAEGMRKVIAQTLAACANVRERARKQAIKLIAADSSIPEERRVSEVDRTFASLDHIFDGIVTQIEAADAKPANGS
ncbi:MAG TPA: hypothetical protein VF409_03155 [Sphingomonas sp.]